jgi:hypothetical protein
MPEQTDKEKYLSGLFLALIINFKVRIEKLPSN